MRKSNGPSKKALMQQEIAAKGKTATCEASSPIRQSPRLNASPNAKAQSPRLNASPNGKAQSVDIRKRKTVSSEADFAAVEPPAENEMTGPAVDTTPSDIEEETVVSEKDNEVLEESAVRKTRTHNPNYLEESDEELTTKSTKRKEVQKSSAVKKTIGNKRGLDMEDPDDEDAKEEEQNGDEDPNDNSSSDEGFKSPLKQQPAIKKLSRGRQRKPFSPAGDLTAP